MGRGLIDGVFSLTPATDEEIFEEHFDQGCIAMDNRNYSKAEDHFSNALAINPRSDECLLWRASARSWQDNHEGALLDISGAIELNPNAPDYFDFRSTELEWLGRANDASADRETAKSLRQIQVMPLQKPTISSEENKKRAEE